MEHKNVVVLFEVVVKENLLDAYLKMAAELKEELAEAGGIISSERFTSLADQRKLLSMSVWESEEAVAKWRNIARHRLNQKQGRERMFESYKISVAAIKRTYTADERENAPQDSNEFFGL